MKLIIVNMLFTLTFAAQDDGILLRIPKRSHGKESLDDQSSAETGFGGGGGVEHSKYFHYQHLPEHDKYEFGYRRGNDHHVRERYEKAIPHEGHFKTKVRWADKKGGHGEHYWDYNHADHHDDGEGGYSDPVPTYTADSQRSSSNLKIHQKRQSDESEEVRLENNRRQFTAEEEADQKPQPSKDYFDFETKEKDGFIKSFEDEIGGVQNFEIQKENTKRKRTPEELKRNPPTEILQPTLKSVKEVKNKTPQLFFDLESGRVIDENTGRTYILQPLQ